VLIQFGHNDGDTLDSGRCGACCRASATQAGRLSCRARGGGNGADVRWYLRRMIAEAREKRGGAGAAFAHGEEHLEGWAGDRDRGGYGGWAAEAAAAEGVAFIDVNAMIADEYDAMGEEAVAALFCNANDHTHTSAEGARVECAAGGGGAEDIRRGVS